MVGALERCPIAELDGAVQLREAGASRGVGAWQPAQANGFGGIRAAVRERLVGNVAGVGAGTEGHWEPQSEQLLTGDNGELPAAQLRLLGVGASRQGEIFST